jgi:uncharacterized OB-fold protein
MKTQPRACNACGALTRRPGAYCEACEYMTPTEAQAKLHVSSATYFRMVAAGTIRPRRIGARKTLVSRVEIDNLLSTGR